MLARRLRSLAQEVRSLNHHHAVPPIAFESMLSAPLNPHPECKPKLPRLRAERAGAATGRAAEGVPPKRHRIMGLSTAVLGVSGDRCGLVALVPR
jgi:hypothetical protein